mgnify:CR=1 FL=1
MIGWLCGKIIDKPTIGKMILDVKGSPKKMLAIPIARKGTENIKILALEGPRTGV